MCEKCGCSGAEPAHEEDLLQHSHDGHHHPHSHAHVSVAGSGHAHEPNGRILKLERSVLAKNDELASRNRSWLAGRGVLALNLVGGPGAGKTSLLERTLRDLGSEFPIQVIEGDQATDHDARRIRAAGGRVVQINTGAGCHLDAAMVGRALEELDPPSGSILFIENVGNLVCPALFDLGEHAKVLIHAVTEGEDKPVKYPHMFRAASLLLLNKVDLLPHLGFDLDGCRGYAAQVNPSMPLVPLSATRGDGLREWYAWLARLAVARL